MNPCSPIIGAEMHLRRGPHIIIHSVATRWRYRNVQRSESLGSYLKQNSGGSSGA